MRNGSVLLAVLTMLIAVSCSGAPSFQGTSLEPDVAPSFQLRDQFGETVGLSDLAGKVMVLTFLYTHCPDVCPIMTETLRQTYQLLGDDSSQVNLVAITLDPNRDSVERAYEYSQERDMLDKWRFLVGSEDELDSIWKSYWLDPIRGIPAGQVDRHDYSPDGNGDGSRQDAALALEDEDRPSSVPRTNDYLVSHTAPVFLIDKEGYRRVLFTDLSLDPHPLVHDIRLLVGSAPFKQNGAL